MRTLSDQVKDLENTRGAKIAQMGEVVQKSLDEGRSMDAAEQEMFDTIEDEVKALDGDLIRLRKLETLHAGNVARATAVTEAVRTEKTAAAVRIPGAPAIIVNREADEKFPGQNFTRMVIAKAVARIDGGNFAGFGASPAEIAEKRWGRTNPLLVNVIRAAVAGHGSSSGEAGAELVSADNRFTGDFIEYLYAQTVYNRLGLREVPANVAIKGQDGVATGYWVGESKPIPVSKADFSTVSLAPLKVGAIAVASKELLRDSSPAAEMLIRDALVQAAAQRIDTTFLSTTASSSLVSPAGLLNGLTPIDSAGNDQAGLITDIRNLYAPFFTANNSSGITLVMTPAMAKAISLLLTDLGQFAFPGMSAQGGTLLGDPVVTGENVTAAHLIAIKPSDVYRIGASGVEVSLSDQATVEMDTAPQGASDTPVALSASPVSMYQTESVAFKVVVPMNFAKRRSSAVAYIANADYGDVMSA